MSSSAVADPGWSPWSRRFYGMFPVAPLWVGVGLVAVAALVLFGSSRITGDLETHLASGDSLILQRDARLAVILCVMAGFIPTAQAYVLRFTAANLAALAPLVGRGSERLALPRPSFWLCTFPGILAMPVIAFSIDRDPGLYFTEEYLGRATHYFQWIVGFFVTVNLAHFAHLGIACGRAVGSRAEALPEIDLLDLSPLAPFARQMLQSGLVWVLMLSIFSVNAVDPGFFPVVALVAAFAGINVWALWFVSNRKLHERIRRAKAREIALVNRAMRGDGPAIDSLCIRSGSGPLAPADLLAYRRFVDDVREWAFDAAAWLRVLLYLAIPLGSWFGGAVVERILDASLR